jgi:hypothetical protein
MCLFATLRTLSSWSTKGYSSFIMIFSLTVKIQHLMISALFILSNDTFPMNWFSNLNGSKEKMYLAFLFVGDKS